MKEAKGKDGLGGCFREGKNDLLPKWPMKMLQPNFANPEKERRAHINV